MTLFLTQAPAAPAAGATTRLFPASAQYTFTAPAAQDTSITIDNATPWGAESRLHVRQNDGGAGIWSALLRFDLSVVPAGSQVISATVNFYVQATDSTPIAIHRVTAAWDEATATWGTIGGQHDATPAASFAPTGHDRYARVDITALARDWLSGAAPNHGILLKAPLPASDHTLTSKEGANTSQWPYLEVVVEDARIATAADDFDPATGYAGSDGSLPWLGPWAEVGEADGPTAGRVRAEAASQCASGACLRTLGVQNDGGSYGAGRGINLTGATAASLSFSFHLSGPKGQIDLEASADGGAHWTRLKSYLLPATTTSHTAQSFSLLPYVAPDTRIRFVGAGAPANGALYVDNVRLDVVRQGIGGRLWDDLNRDGLPGASEPGLRGTTINLFDSSCATATGAPFRTTVTGADGYYAFTSLTAAAYCVRVDPPTLPFSYALTTPNALVDVTLAATQYYGAANFGYATTLAADRLLVGSYAPCPDAAWLHTLALAYDATITEQNAATCGYTVAVAPDKQAALQAAIAADPHTRHANPDAWAYTTFTPNDPDYQDAGLVYGPRHIHAEAAWDVTQGNPAVILAVLDSGLDLAHGEFTGRVLPGFDFVNSDSDPSDDQHHGTHVTGIAGAGIHNGLGIAGIAGGVSLLPVKVLDNKGNGWWSVIAQGITWAVDHGARVLNLSLAGTSYSQALYDAIAYANSKGAVVIAAAGNNGMSQPAYPAAFDNVLAVGASDYDTNRMSFSNYGANVDVMAPGDSIWSTYPAGGFAFMSGTSMAAPHAAGLAALLLSINPNLNATQIRDTIQATATDIDAPGVDMYTGYGLINAQAAVEAVTPAAFVTPTTSLAATLAADENGNGLVDPGDSLRYIITLANESTQPLEHVVVRALLPLYTSYVVNNAQLNGIPMLDDAAPQTALPLDEGGLDVGTIPPLSSATVSFSVVVGQPPRGVYAIVSQVTVQATAGQMTAQAVAGDQTLQVVTPLAGALLQATVSAANAQMGQTLTYSFTTDYLRRDLLSDVVVTAAVPAGTSYAAGSANAGGVLSDEAPPRVIWKLGSNVAGAPGITSRPTIGLDRSNHYAFSPAASMSAMRSVTGTERLLVVGVACKSASVSYIRYNGVYLTRAGVSERTNTRTEIWSLVAPASGAYPLEISLSQSDYCSIGSTSFTGVDQTGPVGGFASAQGLSDAANVTVAALPDELVFGSVAFAGVPILTPGAEQTPLWNAGVGGAIAGAGGARHGTAAAPLSWTASASADWTIGAVPIKPATQVRLGNTLVAAPTLVASGGLITVTQTLTATQVSTGVTPPALTITGTNGVSVVLLSGPTPLSAAVDITGATFTWVYRATATDGIGQLAFGGQAAAGDVAWAWAQSNSVIIHPPLTFAAIVDSPATVSPVVATGYIATAGPVAATGQVVAEHINEASQLPLSPSNTVETDIQASIGGLIWNDLDGDGAPGDGEPGINGVEVCAIRRADGANSGCVASDLQGNYRIHGLTARVEYTVRLTYATAPANYIATTPPTLIRTATTAGVNDAAFGMKPLVTIIGDTIWYDTNANGVQDVGEPGIGNVTLILYRDDGDGVYEPGPGLGRDVFMDATVSDAAGVYALHAHSAGGYFVDITDDNGVLAGLNHTLGPQSLAEPTSRITVNLGDVFCDADFGYVRAAAAAIIGDLVWLDGNHNRVREISEPVLIGVEVCATPLGGGAAICARTDLNGRYLLEAPPGSYTLAPTAPPFGLTPNTPVPYTITVTGGQQYLGADFGYHGGSAVLGGTVWRDAAVNDIADGLYDPAGEPGIANVSINIIQDRNTDGVWDAGEPILATFSSASGDYLLENLLPGAYLAQVSDTMAILRRFVITSPGPHPGQDDNNQPQPYAVALSAGEVNTTADFGYREYDAFAQNELPDPGMIGDLVWYDVNGDGSYTPAAGDHPIAGVTVALSWEGAADAAAATSGYGQYLFSDLPLGRTYTLRVTDVFGVLAGLIPSTPGPQAGQDNQNQVQPYNVTLGVQRQNYTADFGYTRPATVGERVYFDLNGNATHDADEPGIPDVTLDLYRNGAAIASRATDATGRYTFTLPASPYTITIAPGEFAPGGTLHRWTPTAAATQSVTLAAGQAMTTTDFGLTIASRYTVTQQLNTADPVRPNSPISFTLRITNTGDTWLATLPLTGVYSPTFLAYGADGHFAEPDSTDHVNDGLLTWANVLDAGPAGRLVASAGPAAATGMLAPGASTTITIWFTTQVDSYEHSPLGAANTFTVSAATFDPDGSGPLPASAAPLGQDEPSAAAYVRILNPTGLAVTGFRAVAGRDRVTLAWQTANEAPIVGFNLLRRMNSGPFRPVTPEVIPARHAGAAQGADYTFTDAAMPGVLTYILEALLTDGRRALSAPIVVAVEGFVPPSQIFLPTIWYYVQSRGARANDLWERVPAVIVP